MPTPGQSSPSNLVILLQFIADAKNKTVLQNAYATITNLQGADVQAAAATAMLTKEYEKLAKQVERIRDPQQREAFAQRLTQVAEDTRANMDVAIKGGADVADVYNTATDQVKKMDEAVRELVVDQNKGANSQERMIRWGLAGFATMRTGRALGQIGQAMLSPIQKFADIATKTDPVFQRWQTASNSIASSFARIGRVMMSEALPAIQAAADLMEKIAGFVEAHPDIAKGLVIGGGLAKIIGGLLVGIGQLMVSVVMFRGMSQGLNILGLTSGAAKAAAVAGPAVQTTMFMGQTATITAATQLGGFSGFMLALGMKVKWLIGVFTALGVKLLAFVEWLATGLLDALFTVVGSVIGGLVAGFGVNELLSRTKAGKEAGIQPTGKIATVAAYGVGSLFGKDTAEDWAYKVAKAFGYVTDASEDTTNALYKFGDTWNLVAKDATKLYEDYTTANDEAKQKLAEDIAKAESDAEEKRLKIVEDYGQKRIESETKYAEERVKIEEDYDKDRNRIEEDYARESAQRLADFNLKQSRVQEDYALDEAQRLQDHQLDEAKAGQDLQLKLVDIQQKYYDNVEKVRKDHLDKLAQMERDHAFNMSELVAARDYGGMLAERRRYNKEQADENDAYNNRLQDLADNLAKERATAQEDYARKLTEMDQQFALEEQRRQEDFARKQQEATANYALEAQRRAEDHTIQMDQLKAQFDDKMKTVDEQHVAEMDSLSKDYQDELTMLNTEKAKQLADLQTNYNKERLARSDQLKKDMSDLLNISQEGYTAMEEAAKKYAEALIIQANRINGAAGMGSANGQTQSNPTSTGGFKGWQPGQQPWYFKSAGGYSKGLTMTGEEGEEFILNRATTLSIEKLVGGRLNQQNILKALSAGSRNVISGLSGGAKQVSVNTKIDFHGSLSVAERAALRKEIHTGIVRDVAYAIEGA